MPNHQHDDEESPLFAGLGQVSSKQRSEILRKKAEPIPTASIHYVWVGPPSPRSNQNREVAGHDVTGPIEMAKANKTNPIFFWCLDAHKDAFQSKLPKNVTVQSIDQYVQHCLGSSKREIREMAQKMNEIMRTSLGRNEIRDRVTVKDAFTLFLHATQTVESMYTLDTNVFPTSDTAKLASYRQFMLPQLGEEDVVDCWALYSSEPNKKIPTNVFSAYYRDWQKAQEIFNSERYSKRYEEQLSHAIVTNLERHSRPHDTPAGSWHPTAYIGRPGYDPNNIQLQDLPIRKAYYNTHKVNAQLANSDEIDYRVILQRLKSYIINHEWQINKGGKTIAEYGNSVVVPESVEKIWQELTKEHSSDKETYLKIQQIAHSALENEKKLLSSLFSTINFTSIGKRSDDTREFLKKVKNGGSALEEHLKFNLDDDTKLEQRQKK